jgi:hypothetical protein
MGGELPHREHGTPREPAPGYSPECNGLVEWHNLKLVDMARPMLADSDDQRLGLAPLGEGFKRDAILLANDLHNATPALGALVGRTALRGVLGAGSDAWSVLALCVGSPNRQAIPVDEGAAKVVV